MYLTKFLSDENVVEIEDMDGEGIFFSTAGALVVITV